MDAYRQIRVIGKGSFGSAILCEHRDSGREVVVKQVDISALDAEGRKSSRAETSILASLSHPGVIRHYESFEEDGYLCIVTEYASGGDLGGAMGKAKGIPMAEEAVLRWAAEFLVTLHYLHARKILHRDIKLQNIFLDGDSGIRIGDFGIARVLAHTWAQAKTIVGTPYYISPEIASSKPYNSKSDVWAAGCVIFELCAQRHAFEATSIPTLVRKILRGRVDPIPSPYSEDLRALVSLMLSRSPAARPPVSAILQLPFMRPYVLDYIGRCERRGFPLPPTSLPEDMRFLLHGPDPARPIPSGADIIPTNDYASDQERKIHDTESDEHHTTVDEDEDEEEKLPTRAQFAAAMMHAEKQGRPPLAKPARRRPSITNTRKKSTTPTKKPRRPSSRPTKPLQHDSPKRPLPRSSVLEHPAFVPPSSHMRPEPVRLEHRDPLPEKQKKPAKKSDEDDNDTFLEHRSSSGERDADALLRKDPPPESTVGFARLIDVHTPLARDVHFDGVSTLQDPLTHRVEALRSHLVQNLGLEKLLEIHHAGASLSSDDLTAPKVSEKLDPKLRADLAANDQIQFVPLVLQMLEFERVIFQN